MANEFSVDICQGDCIDPEMVIISLFGMTARSLVDEIRKNEGGKYDSLYEKKAEKASA